MKSGEVGQAVSKKRFNDSTMCIAIGQGQITPGDKILIETKRYYHFNHTL